MLVVNQTGDAYGSTKYRNYYKQWLCGSCGCRYYEVFNPVPFYGIAIYPQHHGEEFSNNDETLKHINTKAGPITIRLRKTQYSEDIQNEMEDDE